ncbi:MAG: hypothetical protein N2507_04370 [Candidatus Bipolaricaulota bacterium]|nr:hypothetical protein [Candidatus Bipolaricaulota bacterium]
MSSARERREREREERLAQAFAEAVARGDFHFASDIDVLLVAPELPPHPLRRLALLYRFVTPGIEPKAYTLAEFQGLLAKRDAQLLAMLRVRALLRDDLGLEPALAQALAAFPGP